MSNGKSRVLSSNALICDSGEQERGRETEKKMRGRCCERLRGGAGRGRENKKRGRAEERGRCEEWCFRECKKKVGKKKMERYGELRRNEREVKDRRESGVGRWGCEERMRESTRRRKQS